MSAFLCSPKHIGVVAHYAAKHASKPWNWPEGVDFYPEEIAEAIARSNILSIETRYPDTAEKDNSASLSFLSMDDKVYVMACKDEARKLCQLKPIEVIKLAQSIDYQSCEFDGWDKTPAYSVVQYVISSGIRNLPGYEEAAWSI